MEIQLWRELLNPYELAVNELTLKFRHLIKEHKENGLYSPIEQVSGRVKTISSILEKMQKKKIIFEDIEDKIEDIAGIRIICQFVEDIFKVVELINNRGDMEVKVVKDYLNNIKESGYRSYHIIIFYNVQTIRGPKKIQVEIQIRTLAMDFWATIEHSLQYKYKKNMPEHIKQRLSSAASAVLLLDNEMSSVRSEIMDAQNSFQIKANVVADILNNIQNLYKVANKREVSKIQDEFYKIYRTEDVDQLKRFNKQLDIISEGYRAQAITKDFYY
ncbi:putative GTP pyrophosphokinase [Lachnotalea glycerini]|uniref:GTP pyrophosphokinase family protein n=1 Tax=Lachnotalea glycerini TaxID=1763509 RepID=A0A255IGL6_9FIRM|nr:GTP pyrophosphokinase family protein [Lachnotalea glycerini]PXV95431.1 putative GTP pyrophosphokinase [Lachnotalea glycerini]RDY32751.1 GTP pyrophosphokinase family protein [Lachnotalea glycerini]